MIIETAAWIIVLDAIASFFPFVLLAPFFLYFFFKSAIEAYLYERKSAKAYKEWADSKGGSGIVFKEDLD